MLSSFVETALVRVIKGVRFVLCERFIQRLQVVVCTPVPYTVGELCCEQVTSAGSEGEQIIVAVALVVQGTYSSNILPARSARR